MSPVRTSIPIGMSYISRYTANIIGDKWSILLLVKLRDGPKRFGALLKEMTGISPRMLTLTLRTLERDGLVRRDPSHGHEHSADYHLTPLAAKFLRACRHVGDWARASESKIMEARKAFDERAAQLKAKRETAERAWQRGADAGPAPAKNPSG